MYMQARQFTVRAKGSTPLTLDQIRQVAPSVFAQGAFHNTTSARYSFIPTSAVVEALVTQGFQPFQASQSMTRDDARRGFAKHMLRFRHPDMAATRRVGDVFPEVVLVNGHDGSSAYRLMAGLFRLVCSNGAVVSDALVGTVNVAHRGNVISDVATGSLQIVEHMPEVIDAVARWREIQLSQPERVLLAESAHTLRFADAEGKVTTPILPEKLLNTHRAEDSGTDLWTTFNVIQENIIKGGLAAYNPATRKRVATRGIKGIDQDVRLNRQLWALGQRMFELKAGVA